MPLPPPFCRRYGKIQSVRLIPPPSAVDPASGASRPIAAIVAFMDIRCASKAHEAENVLDGAQLATRFNESSTAVAAIGPPSRGERSLAAPAPSVDETTTLNSRTCDAG